MASMDEPHLPAERVDAPALARRLLRTAPMASLATRADDRDGWPYTSLVAFATGHDGTPVMLLSDLADHTRHLTADDRASLLLDGTGDLANRMAGERMTLLGRITRLPPADSEPLRRRYLARHPAARAYEGFGDFAYWQMRIERARVIGGFAKASWLEADAFMPSLPDRYTIDAAEADILEHMNRDHLDAIQLYANQIAGQPGTGWRLTGVDVDGIDLRRGGHTARIAFDREVIDAAMAKDSLIALVAGARTALPSS
ncbi:MAG: DUF2470 domain-containing protein [Pseudomonadota bacterium]